MRLGALLRRRRASNYPLVVVDTAPGDEHLDAVKTIQTASGRPPRHLPAAVRVVVGLLFSLLVSGCFRAVAPAAGGAGINDVGILRSRADGSLSSPQNPDGYGWGWTDFHLVTDDLGSVTAATDRAGAVVEWYAYDDFGSPTIYAPDGTTVRTHSLIDNDVLFAGARWHADLGLYWMRYRWYDPATGRFLAQDPIGLWGDPFNLGNGMAYVGHSPGSWVDEYGLSGCSPDLYDWHHGIPQALAREQWFIDAFTGTGKKELGEILTVLGSEKFGIMVPQDIHRGPAPSLHHQLEGHLGWNDYLRKHLKQRAIMNGGKLTVTDLEQVLKQATSNPAFAELLKKGLSEPATMPYNKWCQLSADEKRKESEAIRKRQRTIQEAVEAAAREASPTKQIPPKASLRFLKRGVLLTVGLTVPFGKALAGAHIADGFAEGGIEEGVTRSLPLAEEVRDGFRWVGSDGFDGIHDGVIDALPEDIRIKVDQ